MTSNPFTRSLFVQPQTVLKRCLRPLSAWHLAAMDILGLPFGVRSGRATPDDLVMAVYVCTLGFKHGASKLFGELRDDPWIQAWGHEFDFLGELAAFQQHLQDYMTFPDVWFEESGGSRTSGIPGPFFMVTFVLRHVAGISEAEAWDMPVNRLAAYKSAVEESLGAEVADDRQRGLVELAEEMGSDESVEDPE